MSCTHVPDCPLFPKLNASLRGWRDAYCDSDSAWRGCARFQQSQSGRAVPLALLPNGRLAQTITTSRPTMPSTSRFELAPVAVAAGDGTSFEREPVDARPREAERPRTRVAARRPEPSTVRVAPRRGRLARLVAWLRGAV